MSDPTQSLLHTHDQRTLAAHALGEQHKALTDALSAYRNAWRDARTAGWAKNDLTRAGFTDPARLPRPRTTSNGETTE